jgi:general secretion pathway protein H
MKGSAGFTLIEMIIVILVLGIAAGFLIPKFQDSSKVELRSHSRRLALTMRHLREQAILTGRTYRLFFDLGQHRYWVESADESSLEERWKPEDGTLGKGITLPEVIGFTDVFLPLGGGKFEEGIPFTDFYPDGTMDYTVVHIDDAEEAYTIETEPMAGGVYLSAGYVPPLDIEA